MPSRYSLKPMDLSGLRTVALGARGGKVTTAHFATCYQPGTGITGLIDSLPHLLAADDFRAVVDAIAEARTRKRQIIWAMGGHVIKCGLGPVLSDLRYRGFATAFSMNGSAAIHDFEIALAGHTSEDVEAVLPDGSFGSAEETGREMNRAIASGAAEGLGLGESLGRALQTLASPKFAPQSLLLDAYRASTPVTVHAALGTDTPHMHPAADGAAIGAASLRDFHLLCSLVSGLADGGVFLNIGSAVIMPEVFLKALSATRNIGHAINGFTTVNLDVLQHYRPRMNVVQRPHAGGNGNGYALTGHHEIMLPLLAAALIDTSGAAK
jgi:hypothetical protein